MNISELPIDSQRRIDELCRAYELRLRAAEACQPSEWLEKVPESERSVLLFELLRIHVELSPAAIETFRPNLPEYDLVFDRVVNADQPKVKSGGRLEFDETLDEFEQSSPKLVAFDGDKELAFNVDIPGQFVIGSASEADLVLPSHCGLAERQACLVLERERSFLVNFETKNQASSSAGTGSFIELTPSSAFSIGRVRFELRDIRTDTPKLSSGRHDTKTVEHGTDDTIAIEGFEIGRELGRGNFGIVYDAVQLGTGKRFAIKSLLPDSARAERLRNLFMREISIASQLRHPNIVAYHGFGFAGERPYLILDYVEHTATEQIVRRQSEHKRVRLCVRITMKLLAALSYAHDRGIVHRDVKLSNVLTGSMNRKLFVKLADFGLAKFYETAGYSGMTASDAICGTIAYMSPEQLLNSKYAEPDCDVYAVAVCLYRLLTGELPHDADSPAEIIHKRMSEMPRSIEAVNSRIPSDLAAIAERGLHPDRSRRFRTAEEFADDLKPFVL